MTHGLVQDLQARVDVVFRLPGQPDLTIECVVDTGFAGALTLSPEAVDALGLPFFQEIEANLANDADVRTAVHVATIVWQGRELEIAVLAMGRRPLLGTALLDGNHIGADFADDGEVSVEKLNRLTKLEVAQKVRGYLTGVSPGGITLYVQDADVRKTGNWWYVPVRPSRWPKRMSDFFQTLTNVEDDIQEQEHLNILPATGMPLEEEDAVTA